MNIQTDLNNKSVIVDRNTVKINGVDVGFPPVKNKKERYKSNTY